MMKYRFNNHEADAEAFFIGRDFRSQAAKRHMHVQSYVFLFWNEAMFALITTQGRKVEDAKEEIMNSRSWGLPGLIKTANRDRAPRASSAFFSFGQLDTRSSPDGGHNKGKV